VLCEERRGVVFCAAKEGVKRGERASALTAQKRKETRAASDFFSARPAHTNSFTMVRHDPGPALSQHLHAAGRGAGRRAEGRPRKHSLNSWLRAPLAPGCLSRRAARAKRAPPSLSQKTAPPKTTTPQSKKRGLSLDEKKAAVLAIFHETQDVFQLKVCVCVC
jgi:hypothetical protein